MVLWRGTRAEYLKGGQPAGTLIVGPPNHLAVGERDRRPVAISWRGGNLVRIEIDRDAEIAW